MAKVLGTAFHPECFRHPRSYDAAEGLFCSDIECVYQLQPQHIRWMNRLAKMVRHEANDLLLSYVQFSKRWQLDL